MSHIVSASGAAGSEISNDRELWFGSLASSALILVVMKNCGASQAVAVAREFDSRIDHTFSTH
jgi:hypothetical protein